MSDDRYSKYSTVFQKLIDSGRLIETYNPKTDVFLARFKNVRQIYGAQATATIIGEGIDTNHALDDLCDKFESARHFDQVLGLD